MKKLLLLLLFITLFLGVYSQTSKNISAPQVKATEKILTDKLDTKTGAVGAIDADGNTITNLKPSVNPTDVVIRSENVNADWSATSGNALILNKPDTVRMSNYIKGAAGSLAKFAPGDSSVISLSNGADNQILTMVGGAPAWASPSTSSSGSLYGYVTDTYDITSTTLVNITGMSISLQASSTYEIEVNLLCNVSAVTTGAGFGINLTSTTGAYFKGLMWGSTTTSANKMVLVDTWDTATSGWLTTSGSYGGVKLTARLTTGSTAPTLTVKALKTTSGTLTIWLWSYVKATKI